MTYEEVCALAGEDEQLSGPQLRKSGCNCSLPRRPSSISFLPARLLLQARPVTLATAPLTVSFTLSLTAAAAPAALSNGPSLPEPWGKYCATAGRHRWGSSSECQ